MHRYLSQITQKISRGLKSVQVKRERLALDLNALFWKECGIWYEVKTEFFSKSKSKSWVSFLEDIGVPLFTAEFKVALYKKWIIELGYSPDDLNGIHTRKLHRAIPYADSKKSADLILKKARDLSLKDFLEWLKSIH